MKQTETAGSMATAKYQYEVPEPAELAEQRNSLIFTEHYVSAVAVAEHLDIEPRQVKALTRAGKLPAHPIDPSATRKQWRYKLSEVDAAVGSNHNSGISHYNEARQPRDQKGR